MNEKPTKPRDHDWKEISLFNQRLTKHRTHTTLENSTLVNWLRNDLPTRDLSFERPDKIDKTFAIKIR